MKSVWRPCATLVVILIWTTLFLSGCYDLREVNDMNIVTGIGLDEAENGMVRVTLQLVNPNNVPSAAGGQGSGRAFLTRTVEARSVEQAVNKFSEVVPHFLYLSHNTLVVFGDAYAKHGLSRAFDYFERSRFFRRNQLFVVAQGEARDVLAASTTPEPLNSFGVRFLVEQTARRARLLDSEQLSVLKAYLSVSKSPVMALIDVRDGRLRVAGAALFREGTMVGTLTPNEMEALSLLRSGRGEISVSIPCPTSAADTNTSLQIDSWRRNMRSSFVGQRLHLEIQLTVSGEIERLCPGGQLNKQVLRSVQREGEAIIQRRLRTVIEKLQSDGSDAGGFGQWMFQNHPGWWREHGADWSDIFQHADVSCAVQLQIRRAGLSSNAPEVMVNEVDKAPKAGRGEDIP